MYELSPSILSADFTRLGEQVQELEQAGCRWLHIDVMDGMFVPSITYGMPVIKSLRKITNLFFDVHLMIQEPERYIQDFKDSGADMLTVHAEATIHLDRTLEAIHQAGMKAGVALNPSTPLETIRYVLEKADMVLIMTVNPGFGGQSYIPYCTEKVRELRQWIDQRGLTTDIQVDGGICDETLGEVLDAGANIVVAGSYVFQENPAERVREILEKMSKYEE